MDTKIYALIEANTAYENNQSLLPVLSEVIPKSPEALAIVSQLNNLASENDVIVTSLQMSDIPLATRSGTSTQKNPSRFIEIPISFTVEGAFSSVFSFLKELIVMRRIVTIQSMRFTPIKTISLSASESGKPASIKVLISLMTYYETK